MSDNNFEKRVEELLAKWNRAYQEAGVQPSSPLLDRVMAEEKVAAEMKSEVLTEKPSATPLYTGKELRPQDSVGYVAFDEGVAEDYWGDVW